MTWFAGTFGRCEIRPWRPTVTMTTLSAQLGRAGLSGRFWLGCAMRRYSADHAGLEILPFEECLRLLASVPVGGVGFMADGELVILPVNHVVDGHNVAFRTAHGSMLSAAGGQEHVMDDPVMVVLPVGYPLAGADSVDPAEVPSDAWINTTVDVAGLTAPPEDGSGRAHRLDFEGQDFRTALNLVAAGLGVALLPRLLLGDSPPSVVVLPMSQPKREVEPGTR